MVRFRDLANTGPVKGILTNVIKSENHHYRAQA